MRRPLIVFALACGIACALVACGKKATPELAADASTTTAVDAGAARDKGKPTTIAALKFRTSVLDRRDWPENDGGATRLGYLRHGAETQAYELVVPNEECTGGWYELVTGGFVCSNSATKNLDNPNIERAPAQADRDAGLPYRYGKVVAAGTPLYRRVLSAKDREKYESWRPPTPKVADAGAGEEGDEAASSTPSDKPSAASPPKNDDDDDGPPTLKKLKGRGVLVRRMMPGFFIALDKDFKAAGTRWWRTTHGFATPFANILTQDWGSKHRGTWFTDAAYDSTSPVLLPDAGATFVRATESGESGESERELGGMVAFVKVQSAHRIYVEPDGKSTRMGAPLGKRTAVLLTGRALSIWGARLFETSQGFWVRPSDVAISAPRMPKDLAPNEKWIDIDLSRQALVAFEGTGPVFGTLVSTGRENDYDPEHDYPTPTGEYRIREKHVTTTMDGDVSGGGPYSIEDVPWVMYFHGSYALHGAFWHDQFGHRKSHGCVNLTPEDARTLFQWAGPTMPSEWHGIFAYPANPGSRVIVHEDAEDTRERKRRRRIIRRQRRAQ